MSSLLRRYPAVVATILAGLVTAIVYLSGAPGAARVVATLYVAGVILWVSVGMVRDILRGHWGLDILAVVAMAATLAVGEYAAGLIVALMLTGGEALEDYAGHRARRELTSLLEAAPDVAHLVRGDSLTDVPADDVLPGDELLVRPAEIVPVDAVLLSAAGSFDESSLTGEPLPVGRHAGEEVPSGAVNGAEAVRVRAVRRSADSQYQRIIALVREAQEAKAPIVRLADRFAVPFTVFSLALAGLAWAISGEPVRFAEVLVLATPCPLLIAAPVAFLGGLSRAANEGVIVKGGAVLEVLARLRSAAFDKTGTLTRGRPELVEVRPAPDQPMDADALLALAASAEQYSTHVFAAGIRSAATARGLALVAAQDATERATHGVEATIEGHAVRVGKLAFVREVDPGAVHTDVRPGEAAAYVAIDGRYAGALVLADAVREESPGVVQWLRGHGIEHVLMLTGDAEPTARAVAAGVGIETVHAELRPEDKVELLRTLEPAPVLMVGDGVNDAPVLAAADVGIALGAKGATAAGEAADAVILHDDLSRVVSVIEVGRYTIRVALQAIWIGIALSVGLMLVATTGAIPAVVGALAQELVDLATILYALRARGGARRTPVASAPVREEHPSRTR